MSGLLYCQWVAMVLRVFDVVSIGRGVRGFSLS